MTVRSLSCFAAASIIAISVFASPAAAAPACDKGRCETTAQTGTGKPLKLKNFAKKPAAAPANRNVKKKNAKSRTARQARPEPVETDAVKSDPVRQTTGSAVPASTQLPSEAAQAFASYELARVRVVTPEDIDSAQLLSSTALAENPGDLAADEATTVVSHNAVPLPVDAGDINASDRQVVPPVAVSLDTLSRDLAGNAPAPSGSESWFSRLLILLGSAFTAVAAVVRTFFA